MKDICPIALPRVHEHFMKFFCDIAKNKHTSRILDAGGGHGAFSKRLYENGYKNLAACDLFPDKFYFPEIPCHYAKLSEPLPYEDSHFDYVLAVEVMEPQVSECQLMVFLHGGNWLITAQCVNFSAPWGV